MTKFTTSFLLASFLLAPIKVFAITLSDFEQTAVVEVISYNEDEELYYQGSGFLTDFTSGCVVTAAHVLVDENEEVREVTFILFNAGTDEEEIYTAIPWVVDTDLDTAYVCISDETYIEDFRHYFELESGMVNFLDVGDDLAAIGYPSTGGDTITTAFGQLTGFTPVFENRDLIKSDIAVSGGISGGPVITDEKKIVGMLISTITEETGGITTYAVSTDIVISAISYGIQTFIESWKEAGLWEVPDGCFQISSGGHYLLDGVEYYDGLCEDRVDESFESMLQTQYEHWCGTVPEEGYIENATNILNDPDFNLSVDDWRLYLTNLCGSLSSEDTYNFYTPDQDMGAELMKSEESSAVYAILDDGKRHAFPNEAVYRSWFRDDFSTVTTISADELSDFMLGSNVTFHPGTLLKIPSIPKVYLVSDENELQWITDEATAQSLFGEMWATQVHDLSESLFANYGSGDSITIE